jgi:hypothetical protein
MTNDNNEVYVSTFNVANTSNNMGMPSNTHPLTSLLMTSRANSFNRLTYIDEDNVSQIDNVSANVGSEPRVVYVVVEFMRMGEIDTLNEKFHAELLIESRWVETEHIGNEYDPKRHWNPRLYIENAYMEPKEIIRYEMSRDLNNVLYITEKRVVKGNFLIIFGKFLLNIVNFKLLTGSFWERLELQNFPVDVQELSVAIASKLAPSDIRLEEDHKLKSFMNLEAANVFSDQQKW